LCAKDSPYQQANQYEAYYQPKNAPTDVFQDYSTMQTKGPCSMGYCTEKR
jgi:hypothetical protein